MGDDIKTYKVKGETYDIPSEKTDDFLTKFPEAEELKSYIVDKDTFDIPVNKEADFLNKYPNSEWASYARNWLRDSHALTKS